MYKHIHFIGESLFIGDQSNAETLQSTNVYRSFSVGYLHAINSSAGKPQFSDGKVTGIVLPTFADACVTRDGTLKKLWSTRIDSTQISVSTDSNESASTQLTEHLPSHAEINMRRRLPGCDSDTLSFTGPFDDDTVPLNGSMTKEWLDGLCQSTDNGATDQSGDGCDEYTANPDWCGNFDDVYADFYSNTMCCSCGGGTGIVTSLESPASCGEYTWEVIPSSAPGLTFPSPTSFTFAPTSNDY